MFASAIRVRVPAAWARARPRPRAPSGSRGGARRWCPWPSWAPAAAAWSSSRSLAFDIASLRASSIRVSALLTEKPRPLIWLAPGPKVPSRISPSRFTSPHGQMHPSSTIAQPRRWPTQAQRLLAPCRDADEALAQLVTVGRHRRPVASRSRPQAAAPCDSKFLSEPCPTEAFRGAGEGCYRSPPGWPAGPVAQWLEPAAHNRLVAGSSPAGPTKSRQAQGVSRGAERPTGATQTSSGTQSESEPVQPQALSALLLVDAKPGHYH